MVTIGKVKWVYKPLGAGQAAICLHGLTVTLKVNMQHERNSTL